MCLCGTSACEYNYRDQLVADVFHMGSPVTANVIRALVRPKDLLEEDRGRSAPLAGQMLTWHLKNNTAQLELSSGLDAGAQ